MFLEVLCLYRKFSSLLLIFILITLFFGSIAYASNPINVVDKLGYLSYDEIQKLQKRIDGIKSTYNLDTVIVITDNTYEKDSTQYADDYYDYNDYGLDREHSGLLMLINMDIREVAISTTGRAIDIYTDNRISKMIKNVTSPLSKGNFYSACNKFIDDVITHAKSGVPKGQYREERDPSLNYYNLTYMQKAERMLKLWPVYVIPLVISLAITLKIVLSSKGKVTTTTRTYEEGGSFVFNQHSDKFVHEINRRVRIRRESSDYDDNDYGGRSSGRSSGHSSNRSSTHTSSSGRTHGGGRGKF